MLVFIFIYITNVEEIICLIKVLKKMFLQIFIVLFPRFTLKG